MVQTAQSWLEDLFKYNVAIFMYKLSNEQLPKAFDNFFTTGADVHDRLTRNNNEFRVPLTNCKVGEKFKECGVNIWNTLTAAFDTATTLQIFKKCLIMIIVNEYIVV